MTPMPHRVVDRDMNGWWLTANREGEPGYVCPVRSSAGATLTYDELDAAHGPLRPVEPMGDEDRGLVAGALRSAGTRAVGTLAAALGAVWEDGLGRYRDGDLATAQRALVAGRPSSWEATLLLEVTYFGRELLHESPRRVDQDALGVLRDVLGRAVDDEGPHHELAETLAVLVAEVADEHEDGWASVVDQWLRPGALAKDDAALVYRLFYTTSERFDPLLAYA